MPKIQIRNDIELEKVFKEAMYNAIDYTMQKITEENADLIQQVVYDAYTPNYYQRTGEFKEAWDSLVYRRAGKQVIGEFFYGGEMDMIYNPSKGQHGTPDTYFGQTSDWWDSVQEAWGDSREYLADLIYNGESSHVFGEGPWTKKRDAWSKLVNKLDRGKIFTWFEEGMSKQGLKVYKR